MTADTPTHRCEACGEPATRQDVEGVWLCDGDFDHLMQHWMLEEFDGAATSANHE